MADIKWIKITTDIFNDEKIMLLETLPDADVIIVIWFKLLAMAGRCNDSGLIYLARDIPCNDEMLSTILRRPINTIRLALTQFENLKMIEIVNDFIAIINWEKHQNIDGMEKIKEQNKIRLRQDAEIVERVKMGREIRMVPENWVHPKNEHGQLQPMFDRDYKEEFNDWLEEKKQWESGMQKDWSTGGYKPKEDDHKNMSFEEWHGTAPDSRYYMPQFKKEDRTHYMMYESTTEGTPISPAFSEPEKLARWLADNNASIFGDNTATYEQWLNLII